LRLQVFLEALKAWKTPLWLPLHWGARCHHRKLKPCTRLRVLPRSSCV